MSEEKLLQNCRLCNSPKIRLVLKRDDVHIFRCFDCGIVFLGNELDEKAIEDLYKYYSPTGISNYLSPVTKLSYERLLAGFEKYRKNNRLIDVGCGAGHFMQCAAEKDWRADGTEISDEAIEIARGKRQNIIKGDIASLDLEKEKYDVATLFELMEHAVNPEGIIKKLSYIIRPGGLVYMTTPNYNSITRRLLGNRWGIFHKEHIFYFTPNKLKEILNKHGFRIKSVKTENLSLREALRVFKRSDALNTARIYEKQENLRELTEKNIPFSTLKKAINFILNIFGAGETIYITAQKKAEVS